MYITVIEGQVFTVQLWAARAKPYCGEYLSSIDIDVEMGQYLEVIS